MCRRPPSSVPRYRLAALPRSRMGYHAGAKTAQDDVMTAASDQAIEGNAEPATKRDERRAASVAFGAHALHDGYTDLIYVLLPLWQAEFGLGYAEVGLLRGVFAGTTAAFQIPAGLLAE